MNNSTVTGYVNKNNQRNLGITSEKGSDYGQSLYNMECLNCHTKYRANGSDIWLRKCPNCQGGRPSSTEDEYKNLKQQFIEYVEDTIAKEGKYIVRKGQNIKKDIISRYGSKSDSVIPSDYCYNRVNLDKGTLNHPLLFEMLDNGEYLFLGLDYPYNKAVYHKQKHGDMTQVGICENGKRILNKEFLDMVGYTEPKKHNSSSASKSKDGIMHKTSRDVSDGLRYKVFKRDNYKCCYCGSSPAKDPSIELHVDHIIPWSKGGETVLENLQTLCSRCNIGKSADM